jgi:bacterioferritin-associated ferredoxin
MYVCVCNAVTDSDIRKAVGNGVRTMNQLRQKTGCATTCGCCTELATEILQNTLAATRESQFKLPVLQPA